MPDTPPPSAQDPLESTFGGELPDATESLELVRRYQDGDGGALGPLLERYQERLRRIVRIELGSRQYVDSMEIVQGANLVVMRKLGEFEARGKGSIVNWLRKIAKTQILELYGGAARARRNVPLNDPGSSAPGFQPEGHDTLPEERAWREELREILDSSMTKLAEAEREVILLKDYCAATWDEVQEELGRTRHACQELHRRAWIKLRKLARPRLAGLLDR